MPSPPFDVVVVGNVGIDTNVYLHGDEIDFAVEANFTENLDYVGQAGGYSSRGYARLQRRTAFIGSVGDDFSGRFIRDTLEADGIDTSALFIDPTGTARSVNLMSRDGRRKNFYDGKAHMHIAPDPVRCREVLADVRLAHFHLPSWARHLLPVAKAAGAMIACDLQDIVRLDDRYRQDFIAQSDILFFSTVNHLNPAPLMEALLRARPELIVVAGMGTKGCALANQDGVRFFPPVELELPVVDTNGAGDGLAVGFLTSYVLDGYPLEASIHRGQIVARYTCGLKATSSSLITAEQLERYCRMNG